MDTQNLDSGSATTDESEDEFYGRRHDPCGTSYLFTPWHISMLDYGNSPRISTISKLRLGAADACHSCEIVLDALTTYCSGMLSLDSIGRIAVHSAKTSIKVWYRPATGASQHFEESNVSRPPRGFSRRGLEMIEIELFCLEGQELQITHNITRKKLPILSRRIPSGDTSSHQAFQTLHNWLETCVMHHGACPGYKINKLPKRILEIDGNHVYLRERLNTSAMYACLSHCWGSSGPAVRLDKTSFSLLTNGIAIDQLPKTFADSIHLCARLGIRFVWIDACCIMQDDNDDWKEAAATMANIYEQAHLTIAATWARDSNSGLYAPDWERYKAKRLRDCGLYVREVANEFPLDPLSSSKDFPLLTRAWVYQERLLSSRMVHFVKNQIYWQCPTLFTAESGATYDETYRPFKRTLIWPHLEVSDDPVCRWHKLVASYTVLNLTFANDRLPAIAAIVEREMRLRPGDTYIAGIWKSSLLSDIGWQRGHWLDTRPVARLDEHVPTWAWPSSNTQVRWVEGKIERSVKLVDLSFTRIGPAQVGQVLNASITLEGHTYKTRLTQVCCHCFDKLEPRIELVSPACKDFKEITHDLSVDFDWRTGDRRVTVGDTLLVMPIKFFGDRKYPSSFGIILHEVANGDFERMGVLELRMNTQAETYGVETERILRNFIDALPIRQVKII